MRYEAVRAAEILHGLSTLSLGFPAISRTMIVAGIFDSLATSVPYAVPRSRHPLIGIKFEPYLRKVAAISLVLNAIQWLRKLHSRA